MSGYRCVNYYELCRLCTASHGTKTHIFSEEGRRKDLIGKIAVCLPVVIDENDKLPKILCAQCLNQVETIAKFRETCINAQTMLESCLNSSKLRNGGKVYIKDVTPKKQTATSLPIVSSPPSTTTISSSASTQTAKATLIRTQATIANTEKLPTSSVAAVRTTTYQQRPVSTTTTNTTTPSDFLSSIIQAVGIQNMDDTPDTITTAPIVQQQTPQYTITLDSKTIKSNQIHYKIEAAKPIVTQQEQQSSPTFSSTYQNSALANVDEFLKLKTNPQISATIVKRDPPIKLEAVATPKKQKFNLLIASTTTNPQQHQHQLQHARLQQTPTKPTTQTTQTATLQKQVSIQDLKLISPNKCFLPITLKDGNNDQQIVAQIDTKNIVLPTAYLQMKLRPQITAVDSQHVVQLTNIPNTLSISGSQTQIRQQQQTAQILSTISGTAATVQNPVTETKTLFTTSTGQSVTISHPQLATLTSISPQQQQQQQHQPTPVTPTTISAPQTSTIDTPAGKVQLTMLQNVPTSNITHAIPQKSGITIQRIKTEMPKTSQIITKSIATIVNNSGTSVTTAGTTPAHHRTTLTQQHQGAGLSNNKSNANNTITTTTTTSVTTNTNSVKSEVPTCDVCEKVFKRKEHLAQHVKLHLGLRPFKCEEQNCNKAFSRKEHLMRHVISHTGKKMFSCEFCQKLFSRKDNLNKHRRVHSSEPSTGPYICNICNKAFVVKMYYEQHKAMHKTDDEDNIEMDELKKERCDDADETNNEQKSQEIIDLETDNKTILPASSMASLQVNSIDLTKYVQFVPANLNASFTPTTTTTNYVMPSSFMRSNNTIGISKPGDSHDSTVMNLPANFNNVYPLNTTQYQELVLSQCKNRI